MYSSDLQSLLPVQPHRLQILSVSLQLPEPSVQSSVHVRQFLSGKIHHTPDFFCILRLHQQVQTHKYFQCVVCLMYKQSLLSYKIFSYPFCILLFFEYTHLDFPLKSSIFKKDLTRRVFYFIIFLETKNSPPQKRRREIPVVPLLFIRSSQREPYRVPCTPRCKGRIPLYHTFLSYSLLD